MLTWSILVTCLTCTVLVTARPQRVRFPDQPSNRQSTDDGTIIFVPGATRSNLGRALNPLVNTIPREPLTLADPDQFLNAWQFYYPPGPPPASQDDFDAEGSDLPATLTVSSNSGAAFNEQNPSQVQPSVQLSVQPIIQIPVQPPIQIGEQFSSQPEIIHRVPTPVIISPAISGVQLQLEQPNNHQPVNAQLENSHPKLEKVVEKQPSIVESDKEQPKDSDKGQTVTTLSLKEQPKLEQPETPKQEESENHKKEIKLDEKLSEAKLEIADQQASTSNVAPEKASSGANIQTEVKSPPNFKPRFEAGGWTPLETVPGLL